QVGEHRVGSARLPGVGPRLIIPDEELARGASTGSAGATAAGGAGAGAGAGAARAAASAAATCVGRPEPGADGGVVTGVVVRGDVRRAVVDDDIARVIRRPLLPRAVVAGAPAAARSGRGAGRAAGAAG